MRCSGGGAVVPSNLCTGQVPYHDNDNVNVMHSESLRIPALSSQLKNCPFM
jgi:hypothetical protein